MSFATKIAAAVVAASAIGGFSLPAAAQEGVQDPFMLFQMKMIDKNKDSMVSKQEFMAMMEKAWDMAAKKMNAQKAGMSEAQMREFLKSLYVGG